MSNEQWLKDGDCSKCRRKAYCDKPCTIKKRKREQMITSMIREKTGLSTIMCAMNRITSK